MYIIDDKFGKCSRSVQGSIGVRHGVLRVRHGYGFIVDVPVLHSLTSFIQFLNFILLQSLETV